MEDLTSIRETMDYCEYTNRWLHRWGFGTLHPQIRYKTAERWDSRREGESPAHVESVPCLR